MSDEKSQSFLASSFVSAKNTVDKNANIIFPISSVTGAMLINREGGSDNNFLLASGGLTAALSNTFLVSAQIFNTSLLKKKMNMKAATNVSMIGVASAGSMYAGSGLNALEVVNNPALLGNIGEFIINIRWPEVTMGVSVTSAALAKLSGAGGLAQRFAIGLPMTLAYYATDYFMRTGDVNFNMAGSAACYMMAAYAVGHIGQQQQPAVNYVRPKP